MHNPSPNGQIVLKLQLFPAAKKGYIYVFFLSKFKLDFLGIFDAIFLNQAKYLIFLDPMQNFSPDGQTVLKLQLFHAAKKGYICCFLGQIPIQL
jgi:hypothetical protein